MKKIYLTAYLGVITVLSFAQKIPEDSLKNTPSALTAGDVQKLLPQITAKSPNVSGLERHGDYPVNMYSGLASIEIPLYEIKVGNIVVPIKLAYHSSGNKVNDNASWVGLGWSLMGDYTLSRNVRGKADENDFGANNSLLQNNLPLLQQFTPCLTTQLKSDFNQYINFGKDVERDIFTYHTPNKSNSFVLTPNQGIIWQEPEKSVFSYSGPLLNLNLTDESGVKYSYGNPELTVSSLTGSGAFSAWHLTEIQGVKTTDKIKFTYQTNTVFTFTGEINDSQVYNTNITGFSASTIPGGYQGIFTSTDSPGVSSELLKEIFFPMGKVVFVPSATNRLDRLGKSLESIEIYGYNVSTSAYVLIKKYTLTYVYKQRSESFTGDVVMFLDKVNMVTADNTVLGSYSLAYNSQSSLPAATSRAKDYWGYANGQNQNTNLIPPFSFTTIVYSPQSQTYNVGGANREVNVINSQAWMLEKITFPTGGFTDFTYENNQYQDGSGQNFAGGLRIKQIVSNDNAGNTTTKTYKYGLGESGNGTIRSLAYKNYSTTQRIKHPSIDAKDAEYFYNTVTFSSAHTYAINANEGSPVTYPIVTEYEDDGTGANGKTVYTFKDDAFDDLITIPSNGKSAQRNRFWNRGQLLSKVTYGDDGKKKYEQINTYSTIESGLSPTIGYLIGQSEVALTGTYPDMQGCWQLDNSYNPINPVIWNYGLVKQTSSTEKYYDNVDVTKFTTKSNYTDFDPNYYFPRLIREVVNAGEIRGKKYFYPFDYQNIPSTATGELLAVRRMIEKNQINTPIEEISYYQSSSASTNLLISGGKLTTPFSKEDNSSGTFKSLFVNTNKVYLLESQAFNAFGSTPYKSSSELYNTSPSTYTSNLPKHGLYDLKLTMDGYDSDGNLDSYTIANGRQDVLNYSGPFSHDGVRLYMLGGQIQDYGGLNHITNFNYTLPLLGLSSIKAPNGVFTYFNYDSFGRLKTILDHNSKILKELAYDYTNRNVTEWIPREEFTSISASMSASNALKIISYVDGLGRDLQKIIANGSPDTSKDIVASSVVYDAFGRAYKGFLTSPSPTGGGASVTTANLQTAAETFYGDTKPYTEITAFDNSPLNRPITNFGAGNAWRTANKSMGMQYNVAPANTIKRFKASSGAVFCNVEG